MCSRRPRKPPTLLGLPGSSGVVGEVVGVVGLVVGDLVGSAVGDAVGCAVGTVVAGSVGGRSVTGGCVGPVDSTISGVGVSPGRVGYGVNVLPADRTTSGGSVALSNGVGTAVGVGAGVVAGVDVAWCGIATFWDG